MVERYFISLAAVVSGSRTVNGSPIACKASREFFIRKRKQEEKETTR